LIEISLKPPKIENLKAKTSFKNVSILYNILDTLIQNKLIKKIELNEEQVYYLTEKGEEFVSIYKISKERFDLNGGE
jgi:predicted transcriptional regulator